MKRNNLKKKAALLLSFLMTAYSGGISDISEITTITADDGSKSAEDSKKTTEEKFDGTADIYVENVTCSDGEKAVVSVGVVDWDQDISSVEISLSFSESLTLNNIKNLGGSESSTESNTITLKTNFEKKEDTRGRIAELTFSVPSVEMKSSFEVSVKNAVIKNSKGEEYQVNFSKGIITVDSSLKPLNLETYEINSGSAGFSWVMKSHLDYTDGYIIFRNDEEVGRTAETSWFDTGLTEGETYKYTVQAYGEDGYLSSVSDVLEVTPAKASIEEISFAKQYGSVGGKKTTVSYSMNSASHFASFDVYSFSAEGKKSLISSQKDFSCAGGEFDWDLSEVASGDYILEINAVDADGAEISAVSSTVNVDNTAPEPVYGFTALTGDETVTLTWGKSAQLNVEKYKIFKRTADGKFECIAELTGRDTLSYTDKDVNSGYAYFYNIKAVDCFGNESEFTEDVQGTSQDDQTPPDIVIFRPDSGIISGTTEFYAEAVDNIGISKTIFYISEDDGKTWTEANVSEEVSGVKGYNKWQFDTTALTSGDTKERNIKVKVTAFDKAGNESSEVNVKSYKIDNQAPGQVKNVKIAEILDEKATVTWDDVDDADRHHFEVTLINKSAETQTTYTVTDTKGINLSSLIPATDYQISVCAVDNSGNKGKPSEAVEFSTAKDSKAPSIHSINPAPGAFNKTIDISVNASDSISLAKIDIEISEDGETYSLLQSIENKENTRSLKASYSLDLTDRKEGLIYIRAFAYDAENNKSTPYTVQYMIDKTAPDKILNIDISSGSNYFDIDWNNNDLKDADYFRLFRKNDETGEYVLLKDKINTVNYLDYDVVPEKSYSYKLSMVDSAGNESELSEAADFTMPSDVTEPVIERITPEVGRTLNPGNKTISFAASDDYLVSKMKISYYSEESETKEYKELKVSEPKETVGYLSADIPEEELYDGNMIHILVEASDLFDHSVSKEIVYEIDNESTVIIEIGAEFKEDNAVLKFKAKEVESTLGYQIYRRPAGDENKDKWSFIASFEKDSTKNGEYEFTDISAINSGEFLYKVVSQNSNYTKQEKETEAPVEVVRSPEVELGCESYLEKGVEYTFDGTGTNDYYGIASMTIDFGDGTKQTVSSPSEAMFIHKYAADGDYEVVLTAENIKGISSSVSHSVNVTDRTLMGQVTVQVTTTDGDPAAGVYVYTDVDTARQCRRKTDSNGRVTFNAVAGEHSIGVYADGYLPNIKNYTILSGANADINIPIVHEDIITGEFDVTRMTLKEIKAAGIDIDSHENNYAYKIDVKLFYQTVPITGSVYSGGGGGDGYQILGFAGFDVRVPDGKGSKSKMTPVAAVVDEDTKEVDTLILLELPIEGSMLKEFFDVKLHIINNASSEFSMYDNVVNLHIPEGLSLVDLPDMNKLTSYINEIQGQSQATLNWVLRGEEKGSYNLTADYSGRLSKFNETVKRTFESDAITVIGAEALNVELKVPNHITNNEMYCTLVLENTSDIDLNNVKSRIGDYTSRAFGNIKSGRCTPIQAELISGDTFTYVNCTDFIETLHSGETLKIKYYLNDIFVNSVDEDAPFNFDENTVYLKKTEYEKEGDPITFSINVAKDSDPDVRFWYDHKFDEENYADLSRDTDAKEAFDHLMDDDALRLTDTVAALKESSDLADFDENVDDIVDFIFNFEFDDFTDKDKKDYTKHLILNTLNNSGLDAKVQEEYQENVINDYREIFELWGDIVGNTDDLKGVSDDIIDIINEVKDDDEALTQIITAVYPEEMVEEILKKLEKVEVSDSIKKRLKDNFSDAVKNYVDEKEFVPGFLDTAGIVIDSHLEATEALREMQEIEMLKATNTETQRLLYNLTKAEEIDPSNPLSSMVADTAREIMDEMEKSTLEVAGLRVLGTVAGDITSNALSNAASEGLKFTVNTISGTASATPAAVAVLIYDIAGISYNQFLQEDVDNKYSQRAEVLIADSFRNCIKDAYNNTDEEFFLEQKMTYLCYLLDATISEEQAIERFYLGTGSNGFKKEYILTPGLYFETEGMTSDSEYMAALAKEQVNLLRFYRHVIFRIRGKSIVSDGSSTIGFDYTTNTTLLSYDDNYEYSIDTGSSVHNWISCTGTNIYVEPSEKSTHLFIRNKNIEKRVSEGQMELLIEPQSYLEGEFAVRYVDGSYRIDKIPGAAKYQILFSDSKEVSEKDWENVPVVSSIDSCIAADTSCKYAHIRSAATKNAPASQAKTTAVLKKIQINVGANKGGTVSGGGSYDIHSNVKLTASPSTGNTFAGWMINGKIVSMNPVYSFTAADDTLVYAKFIAASDYNITLSSNVETAVVSASNMDGNDSVYIAMVEYDETELVFDHWEDKEGNIVSFLEIYPFIVTDPEEKMELKAIFEEV